jgi:hypothetical protein
MGHKRSSKKSKITRIRKGMVHKTNCDEGYYKASKAYTQIHHMVCISSMTNATIADKVKDKGKSEFIQECLKLTDWDINAKPNVVGLPLKRAFVAPAAPPGWDGWPCHQVEHPSYTNKVSSNLNTNVWQIVLKLRQKCQNCGTECNINAKTVETELGDESDFWMDFLKDRGTGADSGQKGTAHCWTNRKSNINWYIPFSMNPGKATFRAAPKDPTSLSFSALGKYCSEIMFSLLK